VRRTAIILAIIAGGFLLLFARSGRDPVRQPANAPPGMFAANPMLGERAPPFDTVDPNGHTVDLKTHLGKDVIMLDFWATWCGPCIVAMPEIDAVAQKYKDRGLASYAINVGEDPDTVKEFLAAANLSIPVAMDFDGSIQRSFLGKFLPMTVLIGKDGTVQAVHLGFREDLSDSLSHEIEQLLDGEKLVSN
jgi:thiol-disulfide isomerase/thioredoxin